LQLHKVQTNQRQQKKILKLESVGAPRGS
jgi:hypothetical protein